MITPSTYETALMIAVIALLCWGSWAITFKLSGKWRFELYYFDFAFGVVVATAGFALTFGSMGDELSFWDNLAFTAGRRQVAFALAAGVLLNLANMLFLASASISGLAVAFPVGFGLAMIVTQAWMFALYQQANVTYIVVGAAVLLLSVLMNIVAYRAHASIRAEQESERRRALEQIDPEARTAAEEAAKAQQAANPERSYRRRKKKEKIDTEAVGTPAKGIVMALLGGIVMGCATPLIESAREGEVGLGPYTVAFVISIAMFLSTFVLNLYFMNLPVQGAPVQFFRYFQGTIMQHIWGVVGGMIWAGGATAAFIVGVLPRTVGLSPLAGGSLVHAAGVLAAVWGLMVWKEFKGAPGFSNALMAGAVLLFAAGLGVLTLGAGR